MIGVSRRLAGRFRAPRPITTTSRGKKTTRHAGRERPSRSVSTSDKGDSCLAAYEVEVGLGVETCRKLCEDGQVTEAVVALDLLVQQGCHLDTNILYGVLKRCVENKDMALGKRIHALTVQSGYEGNAFLATHLIGMYASYRMLEEAMGVFSRVTLPSAYMWAAIIFAYARHGEPVKAIELYRQMCESTVEPDNRIFVAVLKACASAGALAAGQDVHAHILASAGKPDIFVQTCLVDMYAKCGSLKNAQTVFDSLSQKNVVTWTAMIAGYAKQGMCEKALSLYTSMQEANIDPADSVTFVCLLQACAIVGGAGLHQGKQLHAQIKERGLQGDVVLGNCLVNMYAKCGSLGDARQVFDRLSQKDMVTWNAMIAGYVQRGSLEDARSLFDRLLQKDVVTWTSMIAGYAQQGMGQEALWLYSCMQQEGITPPNSVTFVCLLQACASIAALPLGKQLHAQVQERGLQVDVVVGSSLVNMYAKCGSLEDAQQVFDSLPERGVLAWGALIAGHTRQGDSEAVFDLFHRMVQQGIKPNAITFLSVLTVCSHVGLVDKGRMYFDIMSTDYGINPAIEHYTCMVDLLGRAGHLDEALQIAKTMPFQPNGAVWHTLLGACRKWRNVVVGRQAFASAVMLDDKDAEAYVLMSNIYVGEQMWEEAKAMKARRVRLGAWKQRGQSWWTDMGGVVHAFVVGDKKLSERKV